MIRVPVSLRSSAALAAALAGASTMAVPACVIPLAPDFQDPPAVENFPPFIVNSAPQPGSLATGNATFQVWFSDPNPGDTLSIIWYADFPPLQGDTREIWTALSTFPPSPDGSVQTHLSDATPDCVRDNLAPDIDHHTVTVVISDSRAQPAGPTTPFDGNHQATATWSLLLDCRMSPTLP